MTNTLNPLRASEATLSSVSHTTSSAQALAGNDKRKSWMIKNTSSAAVCIRLGDSDETTSIGGFTFRLAQYESVMDEGMHWVGAIQVIFEAGSGGGVTVTEIV